MSNTKSRPDAPLNLNIPLPKDLALLLRRLAYQTAKSRTFLVAEAIRVAYEGGTLTFDPAPDGDPGPMVNVNSLLAVRLPWRTAEVLHTMSYRTGRTKKDLVIQALRVAYDKGTLTFSLPGKEEEQQ